MRVVIIDGLGSVLKHFLLDALTCLICWGEVRGVKLSFTLIVLDFLVQLLAFLLISNRDEHVLFVEFDRPELVGGLQNLGILLRRDDAKVRLCKLLTQQGFHIDLFVFDL